MTSVEKAVTKSSLLGEGPFWDVSTQNLYYVDIQGHKILKYDPQANKLTEAPTAKQPSLIIPVEDKEGQFIISQDNEIVLISWDGENEINEIEKLAVVESPPETPLKFNDARCDSSGRLWAGVYSQDVSDFMKTKPVGLLYSLDSNRQLSKKIEGVRCSNGIAFNDTTKKMFYIDSLIDTIDRFDFDISTGTISNRQPWFTMKTLGLFGGPDGMTIDSDGNLWVAIFPGKTVLKIDGSKEETLLEKVEIPTEQVSAACWGGKNLDQLFVTTAALEFQGKADLSVAGLVYKITGTGTKGLPSNKFKLL